MKKWTSHVGGLTLMSVMLIRLLFGAQQISATVDEPSHVASGYAFLARGVAGLWTIPIRGHPLLVDAWLALPLYISRPDVPLESIGGWQTAYGDFVDNFWSCLKAQKAALFAARAQAMLLTVLLAAVVWRWGTDWWGRGAGLLALGTLAFDPTLVAHGRLATNDVGVTVLGTWALYVVCCWMEHPCWRRTLAIGGLLALTMLAKGSGVLWAAAAGLMMLVTVAQRWRHGPRVRTLIQVVAAGVLGLLLLWAAYGFCWGQVNGSSFYLPAAIHWEGTVFHRRSIGEYWVFALGQRTRGRWWWYFPLAFLIKNPLALLIGFVIGLGVLLYRARSARLLLCGLFPAFYVGVAVFVGPNLGYRHMLPIHPFLYLTIGGGLAQLDRVRSALAFPTRTQSMWSLPLVALAIWYVATGTRVFPYEIAYFNELVGGPERGYLYLVDSNLAWGQSTGVRDAYLQEHPDAQAEPPAHEYLPAPGRYIVDASDLQGIGTGDPDAYEWFRHREPSALLRYDLLVYDVPSFEIGWFAQCNVPGAPLNEASITEGTGRDDLRLVTFDCTRTWLYPDGGAQPGIYVLHHDLVQRKKGPMPRPPAPSDPFVARHLAQAHLSFEKEYGNRGRPFVLYEVLPREPIFELTAYAVSDDVAPAMLRNSGVCDSPVVLDGPLVFLDLVATRDGDVLEVDTWWKVTDGPLSRPFSVMGHLVLTDGTIIGRSDGLGISPLALAPGDVFVQRHRFSSALGESVWLRTGIYWLDTMDRWTVSNMPGADALLIQLD